MASRLENGSHTAVDVNDNDPLLSQLKQPHFDSVHFLNETLPSLPLSAQTHNVKAGRSIHLQTASTDIQSLLSKLNTTNIRSSSELTSITDEILRSGNRLAYEVEVLRGDTNNLHELLSESLREDIECFVPNYGPGDAEPKSQSAADRGLNQNGHNGSQSTLKDPEFISQLRMLGQVKARLEAVISIFGEALKWPLPPSDLSMATSLISVSAPELGIQSTAEDDKAREIARMYRTEIVELLDSDGGGFTGLESATKRVDDFVHLASIWKGTAEEKARTRFVDGLAKILEDRKRLLDSRAVASRPRAASTQRSNSVAGTHTKTNNEGGAAGLFRNLQRLKDDLYLE